MSSQAGAPRVAMSIPGALLRRPGLGILLGLAGLLSGCVTARLHAPDELRSVGRMCGLAEGEVIQEPEEPKILFLYAISPSRTQLACVARWSRKNHLHLAYIQAVNWQDGNAPQN